MEPVVDTMVALGVVSKGGVMVIAAVVIDGEVTIAGDDDEV